MIDKFSGNYFFLSNFYKLEGNCLSLEHIFQAAKTENLSEQMRILQAINPKTAKHLGRKCTLHPDWETIKQNVMLTLIRVKNAS